MGIFSFSFLNYVIKNLLHAWYCYNHYGEPEGYKREIVNTTLFLSNSVMTGLLVFIAAFSITTLRRNPACLLIAE